MNFGSLHISYRHALVHTKCPNTEFGPKITICNNNNNNLPLPKFIMQLKYDDLECKFRKCIVEAIALDTVCNMLYAAAAAFLCVGNSFIIFFSSSSPSYHGASKMC